jgi:hypothetical protein
VIEHDGSHSVLDRGVDGFHTAPHYDEYFLLKTLSTLYRQLNPAARAGKKLLVMLQSGRPAGLQLQ